MRFAILALAALVCLAETKLGQPLTLSAPITVTEALAKADSLTGKTIQVKGKVTEVCQMAGCWAALVDTETNKLLRVKVTDGDIVFPKDAVGKTAVAEGTLKKFTLTKDQMIARAKHEAQEQGRKFDPASVKGPGVVFQIQGTGAILLN